MGRFGPPVFERDRSGELLAAALEQAGSTLAGGLQRRRARHDAQGQQDVDNLARYGWHRGTPAPDPAGPIDGDAAMGHPAMQSLADAMMGKMAMPSQSAPGAELASALPESMEMGGPSAAAIPAPQMTPARGTPGAFDPATKSFRNGQGLPKVLADAARPDPIIRNVGDGYIDRRDTPEAKQEAMQRSTEDRQAARTDERDTRQFERQRALRTPTKPSQVYDPLRGVVVNQDDATFRPLPGLPARPEPQRVDEPLVVTEGPNGPVYTRRSAAEGARAPSGANAGGATIQRDLATKDTQLDLVDKAMEAVSNSPDSFGGIHGLPIVGDYADQRLDPAGVTARALVANVGSMQIKDRTGATMNVAEAPRLKPFIPNISDTPEAILAKLAQLKGAIRVEADLLRASQGGGRAGGGGAQSSGSGDGLAGISDDDFKRAYKAGKKTEAEIAAWVRANPVKKP